MADENYENPYQSFGYDNPAASAEEFDDGTPTRTPKVIGVLNIVFGCLLGLCGLCQGISTGFQAAAGPQMQQAFVEEKDALELQIEALQEQLESAEDPEGIQQQIDELAAQIEMVENMPDMLALSGMNDGRIMAFFVAVCVIGVLLNVLMIISGIGLLNFREWARRLALWVAGLKILNLIAFALVMSLVVAPRVSRAMGQMMENVAQMEEAVDQPELPAEAMETGMWGAMIGYSVVFCLIGSIYPAICLWQLSRGKVRRACQSPQVPVQLDAMGGS